MKILLLTEFFPAAGNPVFTGGVEARVYHLFQFLKTKHDVSLSFRTRHYAFNTLGSTIGRIAYIVTSLVRYLLRRERRFDIVEGTNFVTYLSAFIIAKFSGAKAVIWYPDVFLGQAMARLGLISGLLVELIERAALKLSWDGVIALSTETKKKLVAAGLKARHVETIYGGVNVRHSGNYRDLLKYKQPTIACIARLVEYKRVKDLVLAIYLLRTTIPNIRAVIVGDGPQRRQLDKLAAQLKLNGNIIWKKGISEEEKQHILRQSHVHVLPSVVEGFGLVTVEALSVGTPVVNADIPINWEILERTKINGSADWQVKGGLLFKAKDYVDLAESIQTLLTDRNLYNQKVREGLELSRNYDWTKINQQTERFYQRLLSH